MTSCKSAIRRVSESFWDELKDINKIRKEKGKPKLSYVRFTSLFPKHTLWKNIKLDAINYEEDD